ncbi:hypothetical protein CRYUN_Cryun18bG0071700 [Craigia yunnanensis]
MLMKSDAKNRPYLGGMPKMGPFTGIDPNVKKPEWLRQKVSQGQRNPALPDLMEPENIAKAIASWGVDYIVLTSVDRDDLPDGESGHFAQTVQAMKKLKPELMVECLTSDFLGDLKGVDTLVHSGLDVFAHNIETVTRLQRIVRDPRAGYEQSLSVLKHAKLSKEGMITKSSIMLGRGETDDELNEALADLRAIDVDIPTLGQYLQVRSSYRAGELFVKTMMKERANQTAASST